LAILNNCIISFERSTACSTVKGIYSLLIYSFSNGVFFITEEEQIDRILAELEGIRYSDKVSSDELDNETDMSQKRVYINAYYPLSIIHFDSFDTGKGIYSYTCVEPSLHEIGKEGLYPNQLGDYKTKKSAEDIFNITEEILDEYIRYITVEDIKELIIEKEEVDFLDFGTFYNSYMESSGIYGYRVMPLEGEKYNLKIKYEEGSYPIHESDGRGYWGRETLFTIDGIVLSDANGNSLDLLHSEEADIDEFISGDK